MISGARFSPCRTWRYLLTREWDASLPMLNVIGLNPSTADETINDPTIRRCIRFARDWGYGGLLMTNIFGYRSTDPKALVGLDDAVGPDNNVALLGAATRAGLVLAAWGADGAAAARIPAVLDVLAPIREIHCLGWTKAGEPRHPLYVRADTTPKLYRG